MQDRTRTAAQGRWLNRLTGQDRGLLATILALPLVSGALLLVQSWLLASVLHQAVILGAPLASLTTEIVLFATVFVVRAGLGAVGDALGVRQSEAIKLGLRRTMFRDLLGRPPVWTAERSSGALSSTLVEQVEALDGFFARYLPAMVQAAILPLAFAVVIFPVDWVVAVLFLVTAPLIPVFMALAGWGAEAASRSQASALNRLSARFADRLRGILTLKLFGEADREIAGVRDASEELRKRTMKVMRIAFLSSAVLEFFAALGVAGVALYIGLTYLDLVSLRGGAELTLAAGLFCLLMAPEVYQPLRLLAAHYHDRASAKAAVAEIEMQLGDLPIPAPILPPMPVPAVAETVGALAVQLNGVTLRTPAGTPILEKLDFDIPAGDHIAILGASGVGKSTLIEAIAGLRPFEGEIRIGDHALGELPEPELRHQLVLLGQRPRLFAGSIADNIRLGRQCADHTAIRAAATRAHVTDFADDLPEGLATELGEDGLGVSGGEIQRIALARVYLRDPGLLLLDEPTAHLDPVTEAHVLDGIRSFAMGRTLIVATHSLAVAARMHRVYRLVNGRLIPAPHVVTSKPRTGAA